MEGAVNSLLKSTYDMSEVLLQAYFTVLSISSHVCPFEGITFLIHRILTEQQWIFAICLFHNIIHVHA
jgi:hypothetical protein